MRDSVTNWIAVPGHATVSRRAARLESITCGPLPRGPLPVLIDSTGLKVYGAGQWQAEKHGYTRRKWRKLHLGADADSGQIVAVTSLSRLGWQEATGYGQPGLAETAIGRYKATIGDRQRLRALAGQPTEAVVGVAVLNCMLDAARPKPFRRPPSGSSELTRVDRLAAHRHRPAARTHKRHSR